MKQFLLLALVIILGAGVLRFYAAWMSTTRAPANQLYLTLTPQAAKARMDAGGDFVLLDVRSQEEYDGGHIPGAVCLPVEDIQAELPLPFEKDAEILVYCRSGRRSAQAAAKLAELGYSGVADFGGILDWPYETTTD